MLTEPLPKTLDVRKAAARGVTVSGCLNLPELERFSGLLADDLGDVEAVLSFSKDEENRCILSVSLNASVAIVCQRCLEPMEITLEGEHQLAVVYTDEQARHLPRHLEPLIEEGEKTDLWSVVEEELILALPYVSYHDADDCQMNYTGTEDEEPEQGAESDRPNPFEMLAQLKPGKE